MVSDEAKASGCDCKQCSPDCFIGCPNRGGPLYSLLLLSLRSWVSFSLKLTVWWECPDLLGFYGALRRWGSEKP